MNDAYFIGGSPLLHGVRKCESERSSYGEAFASLLERGACRTGRRRE